ncbi:hypothetical protein [Burkholderia glumae]|uniref:Uncharacterized protein n=1 Tax=Burkholderia glumae TaxID=337 RepID=A0ABY5BLY8_BURGL|nr:hypothetical protein [Burkholderia glumae]MCM2483232.1 hypothetical protein [Burkholderia glumae]MCM2506549.1 hypothetical protein [Burkholderia glumae]MCM2538220.1 hypothetical protein [Burkholderia glumae]MCM2547811.1 hypothetical protein [Burkholderia glumae]MCQ0029717.1 hypothetical protein [Burkholderia glumae]
MAVSPDEAKAGITRKSGNEIHDREPCCLKMVGKAAALCGACRLDDTDPGHRLRDAGGACRKARRRSAARVGKAAVRPRLTAGRRLAERRLPSNP